MLRVFSISLGCPKNRVDTEHLLGALGPVELSSESAQADLVLINTCAFIGPAVQESLRCILECVEEIQALPRTKRPFLAVAGCLVGRFSAASLAPDLPEVDLFLDNKDQSVWADRLREALGLAPAPSARFLSGKPASAYLKISDGCQHACSFCTIPGIRGSLRSTGPEDLLSEAAFLLGQGVKELVLVAQDTASWGADWKNAAALPDLLERLLPLPGLAWLRLLYLYPAGVSRDLLLFLRGLSRPWLPYFDIPLQHAASTVLARMGRPFARNPRALVDRVRNVFPEAVLRSSFIVGFPGESPSDFQELCDFVEETRFHHLGVFTFHPEEGAAAALLPGQIAEAEKKRRRRILMELQAEISREHLAVYQGTFLDVLVERSQGEWPGLYLGRSWFQAPEIDGLTYISGPGTCPGALLHAEIVETLDYDMVALASPESA